MDLKLVSDISSITKFLGLLLSNIFLIIHLYKFFKTNTQQTLATRNLTAYCSYLILSYDFEVRELLPNEHIEKYSLQYYLIDAFIHYLLSCSVFVMAFDTWLCLRNTVVHLTISTSDSNNLKFFVYRFMEIIISLLLTAFLLLFSDKRNPINGLSVKDYVKIITIMSIRFICTFLFAASIVYINLASINKKKLLTDFSLYLRLLVTTGVLHIVQTTIYVIRLITTKDKDEYELIEPIIKNGTCWEGFIIGILFTFKKNTFRRKQDRSMRYKNLSKSLSSTLSPKLAVVSTCNLHRNETFRENKTSTSNIYFPPRKCSESNLPMNTSQYI